MPKVSEVTPTFSVIMLDENEPIDMRGYRTAEGRLSEIYVKPDGTLTILIDVVGSRIMGQLSVDAFKAVVDAVVPLIECRECGALQSDGDPCVCKAV